MFGLGPDDPLTRLLDVVARMDVDAVIVPNLEHLGGDVPDELVKVCDVITVSPENTYARWPLPLPGLTGGRRVNT